MEYEGRIDQQVKVRGYRIETGEIEEAIKEEGGVKEVVVVARERGGGEKELVAYVVGGGEEEEVEVEEMRRRLKRKLPEYMVPVGYVKLEKLPLTENGKLDRRALPAPDRLRYDLEHEYEEARDEVEAGVAEIIREILGMSRVGIKDNFFEIGGHSLLATQVLTRVKERYGVEVSLRRMFEKATVEGLSEAVKEGQEEGGEMREARRPIERISQGYEELLANLEEMSEEQVEALLSRLTAGEGRK